MALRRKDRRGRGVGSRICRKDDVHVAQRVGLRYDSALAFIVVTAVIHKTAIQAGEIIMPAQFHRVWRRAETPWITHLIYSGSDRRDLLGCLDAILGSNDDAPVVRFITRSQA